LDAYTESASTPSDEQGHTLLILQVLKGFLEVVFALYRFAFRLDYDIADFESRFRSGTFLKDTHHLKTVFSALDEEAENRNAVYPVPECAV